MSIRPCLLSRIPDAHTPFFKVIRQTEVIACSTINGKEPQLTGCFSIELGEALQFKQFAVVAIVSQTLSAFIGTNLNKPLQAPSIAFKGTITCNQMVVLFLTISGYKCQREKL